MSCIFCKIIDGEIPSKKVYEDEHVICFHDIAPKAPIHILVVPKRHISDILDCVDHPDIMQQMVYATKQVVTELGVAESGFRTVSNTGADGGQMIDHFHLHILAGKAFGESFG